MSASESVTSRLYLQTPAISRPESSGTSTRLFHPRLAAIEMVADFLTCYLGALAASFLDAWRYNGHFIHSAMREDLAVGLGISLLAVILLERDGAYRGSYGLLHIRTTERALRIPMQSILAALPFTLLLRPALRGLDLLSALVFIPPLLVLQKQAFAAMTRRTQTRGRAMDQVIVYGAGDAAKRILSALSHPAGLGLYPVAVIAGDAHIDAKSMLEMGYRRRRAIPVEHEPITPALLNSYHCSTLIVSLPNLSNGQIALAVDAARQAGSRVVFLSAAELQEQRWTRSIEVDGLSLAPMLQPFECWHYVISKRMVDLILSTLLLIFFTPIFTLIALFITLDSSGPVLFVQERLGRDGKPFKMLKFRSMHKDTPSYGTSPVTTSDPRITRVGRFLRKTSLDELPQLVNVLLGDMSLVGPRPEMAFIARTYSSEQQQRLQVAPGITGLWQLSADRSFPIHHNIQYDLYYIRNRTLTLDLAILIHTLFVAMRGI